MFVGLEGVAGEGGTGGGVKGEWARQWTSHSWAGCVDLKIRTENTHQVKLALLMSWREGGGKWAGLCPTLGRQVGGWVVGVQR